MWIWISGGQKNGVDNDNETIVAKIGVFPSTFLECEKLFCRDILVQDNLLPWSMSHKDFNKTIQDKNIKRRTFNKLVNKFYSCHSILFYSRRYNNWQNCLMVSSIPVFLKEMEKKSYVSLLSRFSPKRKWVWHINFRITISLLL